MRIAYLVNQYPMVSHSFIRREIHAVERQGIEVERISLRGWDKDLVDPADLNERNCTRYVLQQGATALLLALVRTLLSNPVRFMRALALAWRMGFHSERPLPVHIVYLAEACVIESWLRRSGARHLHAHFSTNSAEVAMLVHVLGGPPWSFTAHGVATLENPKFIGLPGKIHRSAFAVGICSFARAQLMRFAAIEDFPKVRVVHCGLEPAFHAVPKGAAPTARRLVCVGRLCREKAQLLLVDAAQKLAAAGVDFKLVLAGDGELRAAIEERIAEHKLGDRVHITGWLTAEQVRNELLAARALVLPSFAEGLPVVIMEAMALRRPVISTFVAGIPELVIPGQHGWLVPAGDVDALANAMQVCLDASPETIASIGDAARERVLARHDVDVEAGKLIALIRASAERDARRAADVGTAAAERVG